MHICDSKTCNPAQTSSIIAGVSGGLPPSLLTDLTLLLHDMLTNLGEEARAWLRTALSTVPTG